MTINAIVAYDANYGIGKDNKLPWPKLTEDLALFKIKTLGCPIIMGRKTWLSLGEKPLPQRHNFVLTRTPETFIGNATAKSVSSNDEIQSFLDYLVRVYETNVWVIGGAEIYKQFLPFCDEVHATVFHDKYDCGTFIDKEELSKISNLRWNYTTDVCDFRIYKRGLTNDR